jgi:thiol-disulfide isomerase/thioredoxin
MTKFVKSMWMAVLVSVGGWIGTATVSANDRTPEQILKELDAVTVPKINARLAENQTYMRRFHTRQREAWTKRDTLILQLYKADPNHERLPELMAERWERKGDRSQALTQEINDVLAHTKNIKLKTEATFVKARMTLRQTHRDGSPDLALLDEFLKLAPKDQRGATLFEVAIEHTRDAKAKTALKDRLAKEYPDSSYAASLRGPRNPSEWVGKPFELEFTDAIGGSTISMNKLKGKVVVIDYWATWCGPCVAEMPKMKELYAKYRDKGVEFIGVSLDQPKDQGGLESLKTFVQKNGITWPQYYQGNGWKSAFSSSWGINSIPRVFVVDQSGKLHSVDARGKLERIIPGLLKEKLASTGIGAG